MKFMWMKKAQKRMTRWVRKYNLALENDPLWKGRFYIRQKAVYPHTFDDGSGGIMTVIFELVDRKTHQVKPVQVSNYDYYLLALLMNSFIIDNCKVWEETPRPSIDTSEDYRGLPYN